MIKYRIQKFNEDIRSVTEQGQGDAGPRSPKRDRLVFNIKITIIILKVRKKLVYIFLFLFYMYKKGASSKQIIVSTD